MNYIKAKKAREVDSYKSLANYVSHAEAFQKTTLQMDLEEREKKRQVYARLLAQKRINEAPIYSERTKTTNTARTYL